MLASVGAAVAGVAGVMLLRRRSGPTSPGVPQVEAARAEGQHEGRADILEQQAATVAEQADKIEAEIEAIEQKPAAGPPLQEVDDDAEVGRILTRRGW